MKKNKGLSGDQRSVYLIVSGPTDRTSKNLQDDSGEKTFRQNFPSKF